MKTDTYKDPSKRFAAKKGPSPGTRTVDELYEVFVKEFHENAEDSTRWVFYAVSRTSAQRLARAFMQRFDWITSIDILFHHERMDQYRRREEEDNPDTAEWWHCDLTRLSG